MSDDSSNDSGSTDLKQTLDCLHEITRDFESLTAQLSRDSAMIATLSMQSQRSSGRAPANQQTTALPALLEGVAQSLARQKALGKQLINDVAVFAAALIRWAQDLERQKQQQRDSLSPAPSVFLGKHGTPESDEALSAASEDSSNDSEEAMNRRSPLPGTGETEVLEDRDLLDELETVYQRLQADNPANMAFQDYESFMNHFDTSFYNGIQYVYNGEVFPSGIYYGFEVNYIGVGMALAARGLSWTQAKADIYLWKTLK